MTGALKDNDWRSASSQDGLVHLMSSTGEIHLDDSKNTAYKIINYYTNRTTTNKKPQKHWNGNLVQANALLSFQTVGIFKSICIAVYFTGFRNPL